MGFLFPSSTPPAVPAVNPQAVDTNAAKTAADAEKLEQDRLKREKGAAATILTSGQGAQTPTVGRKTLIGGGVNYEKH